MHAFKILSIITGLAEVLQQTQCGCVSTSPEQRNPSAADALRMMLGGQARWKGGIGGRGCSGRTTTLASSVLKAKEEGRQESMRLEEVFLSC